MYHMNDRTLVPCLFVCGVYSIYDDMDMTDSALSNTDCADVTRDGKDLSLLLLLLTFVSALCAKKVVAKKLLAVQLFFYF